MCIVLVFVVGVHVCFYNCLWLVLGEKVNEINEKNESIRKRLSAIKLIRSKSLLNRDFVRHFGPADSNISVA